MSRTSGTNGKRPEYRALEIMTVGKAVTPSAINKYVGTGDYASKYMSFLKRDGFGIDVKRDGRTIVSYTITSKPDDAKLPAGAFAKEKVTVAKTKAPAKKVGPKSKTKPAVKAKAKTKIKVSPVLTTEIDKLPAKKVVSRKAATKKAEKPVAEKPIMDSQSEVETPVMDNGDFNGGSFGVDPGFDEMGGSIDPSFLA